MHCSIITISSSTARTADIDDPVGEKAAGAIRDEGGRAAILHTDVTIEKDVVAMVDFAVSTFGACRGLSTMPVHRSIPC